MNSEKKYNQTTSSKFWIWGAFLFLSFSLYAQQENTDIRAGNRLYEQGEFAEAEVAFRRALETNQHSFEAHFNLGNALFRQERFEEALRHYAYSHALLAPENEIDRARLAVAYHNLGNAFLMNGRFAQSEEQATQIISNSIEAYKNSLRVNPLSDETRFNLAFAQNLLNNPENRQPSDGGDGGQDEDQTPEPQPQPQNQQPQPIEPLMSPENAQQILNALLEDEREVQERVRQQQQPRRRDLERDW